MLKKSVDCLGSTLSQCALDHQKLESMFWKKQVSHIHAHQSRHTHASQVHTHDTLYVSVYTYTHCGRTGHLARFCYDRINISKFANKFIWVRKGANPHGPKRIWVPKDTPIVFDVGVGSLLTWEFWCLDDGCVWAWWTLHWMCHLQGCLVGPPWFGDLEISPIGFDNYL